ncbi:uncharacterized protein LOC128883627 isoform X4 [Hylaeus volcanicus]|uniref:uncharacterized protein LOC128883627 isoform X4 n=1 Tax=Hylaeus volcanicus TaxID=313075 RepID=UPI0023B7D4C1|nr:uncharacterized protein LOC128883627 isoform X4 [Hylaeus volcanicus]
MQSCRECKGSTCLIRSNGKHSILLDSTHDGKEILCKPFLPPFHIIRCDEDVEKIKTKTYGTRISTFLDSLLNPPTEEIHLQASPLNPLEEIEPFVLWTPPQDVSSIPTEMRGLYKGCIIVDPILTKHLRAHQRIGVQFLFNCLMGLTTVPSHLCASLIETPLSGCILADDMGLGKTLQCITILYTLLHQGFDSTPAVRKSLIVTPASLVRNWASELDKWLGDKCKYTVITSSSKDHVVSTYKCFQYDYQVIAFFFTFANINKKSFQSRILITSYESLRLYSEHLHGCHVDMVICDEAHRLKNEKTKIVATIASLKASKKLLLSGTPVQNSLDELFTLSSLCISESIIGNASFFRRKYTIPILSGQQMDATENAKKESQKKFEELSYFTSIYILRRTNNLLQEHLPSKTIYAIFCRMSENQKNLYTQTCNIVRKTTNLSLNEKNWSPRVLAAIQNLMKICNHPALIEKKNESSRISTKNLRRTNNSFDVHKSGKLFFLLNLLINIRCTTWVNSQEETLLENLQLSFLRLDGTTSIKHRHDSVTKFNQPSNNYFAFLLSSKAGGCGINLIGANRLILFDPDWNPAQDKQVKIRLFAIISFDSLVQALARIWREGQKKQCYVYRLFATGTIEERILERQVTKDNLADVVAISEGESLVTCNNSCTERPDAAQNLFVYDSHTTSIIHAKFCMKETCSTEDSSQQLLNETDLSTWSHHTDGTKIEDAVLKKTLKETVFLENKITVVSFVMSFHIGLH